MPGISNFIKLLLHIPKDWPNFEVTPKGIRLVLNALSGITSLNDIAKIPFIRNWDAIKKYGKEHPDKDLLVLNKETNSLFSVKGDSITQRLPVLTGVEPWLDGTNLDYYNTNRPYAEMVLSTPAGIFDLYYTPLSIYGEKASNSTYLVPIMDNKYLIKVAPKSTPMYKFYIDSGSGNAISFGNAIHGNSGPSRIPLYHKPSEYRYYTHGCVEGGDCIPYYLDSIRPEKIIVLPFNKQNYIYYDKGKLKTFFDQDTLINPIRSKSDSGKSHYLIYNTLGELK